MFYTANNIAYSALTALVTKNSKERVQMGSFRFIFAFSTSLFIQTITVGAVDALGGGATGWRNIAFIYCILGVITNTLAVFSVKELPEEELNEAVDAGTAGDDKLSLVQSAKLIFSNKYYCRVT